eukprot:6989801-Pyramimonas_sp.AAC.1
MATEQARRRRHMLEVWVSVDIVHDLTPACQLWRGVGLRGPLLLGLVVVGQPLSVWALHGEAKVLLQLRRVE